MTDTPPTPLAGATLLKSAEPGQDRRVVTLVVAALAVLALAALVGIVVLTVLDKKAPDVLGYVATTGIGALGAVLASTRSTPETGA